MKATLLPASSRKEVATGKFSFLFLQLGANYQKASVPQCIKGKAQFLDKYKDKQHKARWRSKKIHFANPTNTKVYNQVQSQMENNKKSILQTSCGRADQSATHFSGTLLLFFFILYPIYCIFFYCSALKMTKYKEKLKYPKCSANCFKSQ